MQNPECPRWTAEPIGERYALTRSARGLQGMLDRRFPDRDRWPSYLWLRATGVIWDGVDERYNLSFADISQVRVDGSTRVLMVEGGCLLVVPGSAYRRGEALIHAIDAAVAPQLRVGPDGSPAPVAVQSRRSMWRWWLNRRRRGNEM